jgi:hypothetical protein
MPSVAMFFGALLACILELVGVCPVVVRVYTYSAAKHIWPMAFLFWVSYVICFVASIFFGACTCHQLWTKVQTVEDQTVETKLSRPTRRGRDGTQQSTEGRCMHALRLCAPDTGRARVRKDKSPDSSGVFSPRKWSVPREYHSHNIHQCTVC